MTRPRYQEIPAANIPVARSADGHAQVRAIALKDDTVRKFVDGKAVKKTIYVQDRLLNLVV